MVADGRLSSKRVLNGVRYCLGALLGVGGHPAYGAVWRPNCADLSWWQDGDADLLFAGETSISGLLFKQWNLRVMPQKAAVREMVNGKLRRLLAHNRPFDRTYVKVGTQRTGRVRRGGVARW